MCVFAFILSYVQFSWEGLKHNFHNSSFLHYLSASICRHTLTHTPPSSLICPFLILSQAPGLLGFWHEEDAIMTNWILSSWKSKLLSLFLKGNWDFESWFSNNQSYFHWQICQWGKKPKTKPTTEVCCNEHT